jgi:hypothetical protein
MENTVPPNYTILGLDISLKNIGVAILRVRRGKHLSLRSLNLDTSKKSWIQDVTDLAQNLNQYGITHIAVEQDMVEERVPGYQILEQDQAQIERNNALSTRTNEIIRIMQGHLYLDCTKIHASLARNIMGFSRLKSCQTDSLKNIIGKQFCEQYAHLIPDTDRYSLVKEFVHNKRAPNSTLDNKLDAMIQCLAYEKRYITKEFNEVQLRKTLIREDAASWMVGSSRLKSDPTYKPLSIWTSKEI